MVGRGQSPERDEWNAAHENLIVTRHGRDPFGAIGDKHSKGGRASALAHRAETTTTLLRTMADHPGATVPQLSRLTASSAPRVCTRLGKLADMGLTCGPMCLPGRSWTLTAQGRELAITGRPVINDLDQRIDWLVERGLVEDKGGKLHDRQHRSCRARHRHAAAPAMGQCRRRIGRQCEGRLAAAAISERDAAFRAPKAQFTVGAKGASDGAAELDFAVQRLGDDDRVMAVGLRAETHRATLHRGDFFRASAVLFWGLFRSGRAPCHPARPPVLSWRRRITVNGWATQRLV